MRDGLDAMLLVRADLAERLNSLQRFARPLSTRDFTESVRSIRRIAAAYGLTPVVRLADALERAAGDGDHATRLYLDRLRDAIGCERVDDQASEAMIASVSVRLGA